MARWRVTSSPSILVMVVAVLASLLVLVEAASQPTVTTSCGTIAGLYDAANHTYAFLGAPAPAPPLRLHHRSTHRKLPAWNDRSAVCAAAGRYAALERADAAGAAAQGHLLARRLQRHVVRRVVHAARRPLVRLGRLLGIVLLLS